MHKPRLAWLIHLCSAKFRAATAARRVLLLGATAAVAGTVAVLLGLLNADDGVAPSTPSRTAVGSESPSLTPGPLSSASGTAVYLSRCPFPRSSSRLSGIDDRLIALFDGKPDQPLPACDIPDWDVQVHSRDISTWYELESIQAQHGADCSGPPSSHENHTYEASVFQCRDHVMTAINAGGYGAIYLTPNQMLDFSAGGSVSFDVSTARMSTRDWWDVWVTPYEDNLALPFDSGEVDLQGTPRRFVHVDTGNAEGAPVVTVNGTTYNTGWNTAPFNQGVTSTNPAADRQPFRITLSRTNIKVERLASATGSAEVFIEASFPALNWTTGVVQIGQHSYNPTKDGSGVPATWHWDNIGVSPTLPFTIIKGDRRFVDSVNQPVTFASPAPTNAMLRFSAVGIVDVSFDGGATYQRAVRQWASANGIHPEHMSSYWTPIPTGTSSVKFRFSADGWYPGPFIAKDFALWVGP